MSETLIAFLALVALSVTALFMAFAVVYIHRGTIEGRVRGLGTRGELKVSTEKKELIQQDSQQSSSQSIREDELVANGEK